MNSRLLDVAEAAEQLGVARKTLYKWVEAGTIPFIRIGRLIRFRESDMEEWIEQQVRRPDTPREERRNSAGTCR